MDECIFCRIVQGEIPCYNVYEDKDTLAFLDVQPHAQGHTVVIPKKHGGRVFYLTEAQTKGFMADVVQAMKRVQEVLDPDGFNVGWNQNTAGGQVVPHLHVHIFPRYTNDGGGSMHSIIRNPGKERVEDVAKRFRKE